MELSEILQPNWAKVRAVRERTTANEIIATMGDMAVDDDKSLQQLSEKLDEMLESDDLTAEDVAMLLIRQMAGFRWRLGECLHMCGRHSSASVMWSIAVSAEAKANSLESKTLREVITRSAERGSEPGNAAFADPENMNAAACAHNLMTSIDNELASSLNMLMKSLIQARDFVKSQQVRLKEEGFSGSDWLALDWSTLFHAMGAPFDPFTMSMVEIHDGDDSLAKSKYLQLTDAFGTAMNRNADGKCEPLNPASRSAVEQALASVLDMTEPRGLEEVRAAGEGSLGMCQ